MKNIQIIEPANNCMYDIFACTNEDFEVLFPGGTNIAFHDEIWARSKNAKHLKERLEKIFSDLWNHPLRKADAMGIHGIIFYQLEHKKQFYPTRKDEEASVPGGGKCRKWNLNSVNSDYSELKNR